MKITKLLYASVLLVIAIAAGKPARADSLCPSCTMADVTAIAIQMPDTIFTLWPNDIQDLPNGDFIFKLYGPEMLNIDFVYLFFPAWASNASDLTGSYRNASNIAMNHWLSQTNGDPGWVKDANGFITYTDPIDPISNPEPSSLLLLGTGIAMLFFMFRRKKRLTSSTR